jgi:histidine phosphotransferase ChpT
VLLQDSLVKALSGDAIEIQPKFAPAYIVSRLAKEARGRVTARLENEIATFTASFPKT